MPELTFTQQEIDELHRVARLDWRLTSANRNGRLLMSIFAAGVDAVEADPRG